MPKLGWRSGLSRIKRSSKRHCSRSYCLFSVQPDSYSHSSNSLRLSTPQMRSSADTCATIDITSFNAVSSGVGGGLSGLIIMSNTTGDTATGGGNKVVEKGLQVP